MPSSCSRQRQGACVAAQHSSGQRQTREEALGRSPDSGSPYPGRPFMSSLAVWALADDMRRRRPLPRPRSHTHRLLSASPAYTHAAARSSLTMPFLPLSRRRSAAGRLLLSQRVPVHPYLRARSPPVVARLRLANCTNVRPHLSHYSLSAGSTPSTSPSTFFTLHSRTRPLADECPFPQTAQTLSFSSLLPHHTASLVHRSHEVLFSFLFLVSCFFCFRPRCSPAL